MFCPLIADGEPAGSTWQLVLAALLGGGLAKAADFVVQFSRERRKVRQEETDTDRKHRKEDLDESLTRMEKLLDRAERQIEAKDRQIEAKDRQINDLTKLVNVGSVRAERAIIWIKHLEATLRHHKIAFDPWHDDDGEAPPGKEPPVGPDEGYP